MTFINGLVIRLFLRYVAFGDGYAKDAVRILAPKKEGSFKKGVVCGESGAAGVAALMAVAKAYRDDAKRLALGCVMIHVAICELTQPRNHLFYQPCTEVGERMPQEKGVQWDSTKTALCSW